MRSLFRFVLYLALVCVLLLSVLAIAAVEPDPLVTQGTPPETAHVEATKGLLGRFREATTSAEADPQVTVSGFELQSVLVLGARTVPGSRATSALENGMIHVRGSIPLGLFDRAGPWINVHARIPDFDDGVRLEGLRVGRIELPPDASLELARVVADLWFGEGTANDLIAAFPQMTATMDGFEVAVDVDREGRGEMARSLFSVFRGDQMPSSAEVQAYHRELNAAFEDGLLRPSGSFSNHLQFLLTRAYENGQNGDLSREYAAAVFALTSACGSEHIRPYLEKLLPGGGDLEEQQIESSPCGEASLHDRIDLRRHFITAAALQAASNRGVAVSIGEFKELNDLGGNSGFDFTDIVANNSGIRLSDLMMKSPAEDWPLYLAMLSDESNFVAPLDGVPTAMDQARFEAEYSSLESPEYQAEVDRIESRIDTLPLHGSTY